MVDLISAAKVGMLMHKLNQFRRHPDWNAAFKKIVPQFTIEMSDGRRAIPDENVGALFELADAEFFGEIVRRELKP